MAALAVPASQIPALLPQVIGGRSPGMSGAPAHVRPASSYAAGAGTSGLAIASIVLGIASWFGLSLLGSIPAIVTGHLARRQIRDAQGAIEGSGLALVGLIAGYANVIVSIVFLGTIMSFLGSM